MIPGDSAGGGFHHPPALRPWVFARHSLRKEFCATDVATGIGKKSLIKIETFLQLLSFCPSHKTGNARQYEGLLCYCELLD